MNNFSFIDWLRGFSALAVMYFHLILMIYIAPNNAINHDSWVYHVVYGFLDLGKIAVAVFFIVSGFLIPSTLRKSSPNLRDFIIHRIFRIYPAYWMSIIFYVIVEFAVLKNHLSWFQVAVNLTMLQQFIGVDNVVGAFWTLQIELIFYGLCCLLFKLNMLQRRNIIIIGSLALGLVAAFIRDAKGVNMPLALFIALALMFLGDEIRCYADGIASQGSLIWRIVTVFLGVAAICWVGYGEEGSRYLISYWIALVIFLISFIMRIEIARQAIANEIGKFLADCSYNVYLLHGSIGLLIGKKIYEQTGDIILSITIPIVLVMILSFLIFRLLEIPAIRLGRRISSHQSGVE